jgi:hypothetical protein
MSNLSKIFGGGTTVDSRKEGLPLFALWGGSSDSNTQMNYRVFDSNFRIVSTPWAAVSSTTTNYRFGVLSDGSHAYNMNDHGNNFHDDLTTQGYSSWTNYIKSLYQIDQYPHCFHYTVSRGGYPTWQSYHQFTSSMEYQVGWTKINMVLPEGIRPRRTFVNRRHTMREMMGNSDCNSDYYNYTSHLIDPSPLNYATGTGYNEKNKMLVMIHSGDESGNTSKSIHIFRSSVCLNEGTTRIKDFFDNLESTEYFTDTWTNQNNKDWCVVVGNNNWVGFGLKQSNSKRYGVFDCNLKGAGLAITGASRQWSTWQDFAGSTTTSYGATGGHQYYTKFQTTWDGTWGMIYSPYYYYGPGINAFCMSIENPRKFININQTKTSRSNPWVAWGRTGFHGGWSDNCDSEVWQTYAFAFDPKDSDHTVDTRVYKGSTSGEGAIPDNNSLVGGNFTNKTGVCSLDAMRTGLHGGTQTTNYPMLMGVNWWGNYGSADISYGGK